MRTVESTDGSATSLPAESTNVKIHTEGHGAVNIAIPKGRRIQVSLELDASGEIIKFGAIPSTIHEDDTEVDSLQENRSNGLSRKSSASTLVEEKFHTPPSTPPLLADALPFVNSRLPLQPRVQRNTGNVEERGHIYLSSPQKQILPVIPSLRTQSTQDMSASVLSPSDFPRTPPHSEFHDNTHHHQSNLFYDDNTNPTHESALQREPESHNDTTQNDEEPYVMQTTERCDSMSTFGMKSNIIRNADIFRQQATYPTPPQSEATPPPKKKMHTLTTKILAPQAVLVKPEKSVDTRAAEAAMLQAYDRTNDRYELLGKVVDFVDAKQSFGEGDTISTTSSVTESHALHMQKGRCHHCCNGTKCTKPPRSSIRNGEPPDMVSDIVDLLARTCVEKASRSVRKLGMLQPYHSIEAIKNNGRRISSRSVKLNGSRDEFTVISSSYAWRG
uniref:Uncharacterized protein n=1 Tax=Ditylum brightwellii TaxID=49249 RepID=A0A7S4RH94_9STRA